MTNETKNLADLTDSRLLYAKNPPFFGYIIIIIIAVLLAGVVVWSLFTPKVYIVKGYGVVEGGNKNTIMSAYSGEIVDIKIQNGDYAQEGDLLFSLKCTDLDLEKIQVDGKIAIYEKQITQLQKLEKSIKDSTNYFDANNEDDKPYYNQYKTYRAHVDQDAAETATASPSPVNNPYNYYGPQPQAQPQPQNQDQFKQRYYAALTSVGESINSAKAEKESLKLQQDAIAAGQSEYTLTAKTSGIVHMNTDYKTGMVIQGGSLIGSIASENDAYTIKAYINVNDMSRVETGNHVDIAVSGLMESVYGIIPGTLTQIDSDMTQLGGGPAGSAGGNSIGNQESPTGGGGGFFKLDVTPDSTYLVSKSGKKYNLSNGTVVETRIKYDEVTYFMYFLESLGFLVR
jgi:multidrug resistance efflux pump